LALGCDGRLLRFSCFDKRFQVLHRS
jgi:hypothetical protein